MRWGFMAALLYALKWFHIGLFIGLVAILLTGCWDTVTTMTPGETMELPPMTIGEDYRIDSCQVTRLVTDAVVVNANALAIFQEANKDKRAAKRNYLNRTAHVTGTVSAVTNFNGPHVADRIELTLNETYSVRCELREDLPAAELHPLFGKTVTIAGRVDNIWFESLWLFDCTLLEIMEVADDD